MSAWTTKEYSTETEKGKARVLADDEGDARQYFYNHPELNYKGEDIEYCYLSNGDVIFTPKPNIS